MCQRNLTSEKRYLKLPSHPLFILMALAFAPSLVRRTMASVSSTPGSCSSWMSVMPPIGLGTFMMEPHKVEPAIRSAIQLGYRRIDCAPVYFNEDKVGDALESILSEGLVKRDELFLVSKLASPFHRKEHVKLALRKTLNDLKADYLDLYLIHWPVAFEYVPIDPDSRGFENEDIDDSGNGERIDPKVSIHETWEAMESLVDEGLVKYIGVSNFPVMMLHTLLSQARIKPFLNQCEGHPYLQQPRLHKYCEHRGIHFQAYSPLGSPGFKESNEPNIMGDPVILDIAKQHKATPAQICIAWAINRGTSVVVKSESNEHQRTNFEALSINLTDTDFERIAKLDTKYRFFRPEEWWPNFPLAVFD